ncbi:M12 family metallo-peptidase [Microbulbifer sp. JTAC008]|uniref:M12 family metallo-peptidase n=1 Tax=unclassified Microbulbifer TaxID=2619833 RepID=UPI00403A1466
MMKNIKWIFWVFLMLGAQAFSEQDVYELFIERGDDSQITSRAASRADNKTVKRTKYNPLVRKVNAGSKIKLNIDDKTLLFDVKSVNRKSDNRLSFSGFTGNRSDFLNVAENDGRVVGSLSYAGKLYKIRPDKNGDSIISEVDQSALIDHDENYYANSSYNFTDMDGSISNDSVHLDSSSEFTVIVAYTEGFLNEAVDVDAYMDLLEQETNTAYINSSIDTRVKIIHAYQTSYSQSGSFSTDREYFSNTSNPETQELLSLRDSFNADVMMVLTGNDGYSYCGIAREIGASEDTALALAKESCAAGYYSFGHELGHLFGARHIIDNDPSTTPFVYGHGYCNTRSNTWHTVMAYNCPSDTGGLRIQQWSNPNISINGEPTGTVDLEFNARVINERAQEVANYRQSSTEENLSWLIPVINLVLL